MGRNPGQDLDFNAKPGQKVPPLLTWILLFLLLAGGYLAWWQTEWGLLEQLEVRGAEKVSRTAVLEVASSYRGEVLWSLPLGQIREEVLELPRVKEVKISRQWPHGVEIHLQERQEAFLLPWEDRVYTLCEQGVVLETVNWEEQGKAHPVITGVEAGSVPEPGEKLEIGALPGLTGRYRDFPPDFWDQVAEVNLDGEEVVFVDQKGVEIHFGVPEAVHAKVEMIQAAYREADRPVKSINVRGGEKAHVTFEN